MNPFPEILDLPLYDGFSNTNKYCQLFKGITFWNFQTMMSLNIVFLHNSVDPDEKCHMGLTVCQGTHSQGNGQFVKIVDTNLCYSFCLTSPIYKMYKALMPYFHNSNLVLSYVIHIRTAILSM